MSITEEVLVRSFASAFGGKDDSVVLGVGDDAAVIIPPANHQIVVSTDSLVAGIHFPEYTAPENIGYKSMAVSLSDLAAMGAQPRWAMLSCCLPERVKLPWIKAFSSGITQALSEADVSLVGGDTCQGPMVINTQLMGVVEPGQALTQSGAQCGDVLVVSGELGLAGLGLDDAQRRVRLNPQDAEVALKALDRPKAQIALGRALQGLATACIDISDGLVSDAAQLCHASQMGAELDLTKLPIDEMLIRYCTSERARELVLAAGDEYQLCFTIPPSRVGELERISADLNLALTPIGTIIEGSDLIGVDGQSRHALVPQYTGYQHQWPQEDR